MHKKKADLEEQVNLKRKKAEGDFLSREEVTIRHPLKMDRKEKVRK